MKSELIHLLTKLKLEHPDFQNLIFAANGASMACLQHGYRRFESLDDLEAYAWPQSDVAQTASSAVSQTAGLPLITLTPPATSGFLSTPNLKT